jgi:hypothetical protein
MTLGANWPWSPRRRALVIAPKTLLAHWARELHVCGVGRMTHEYFGTESERWAEPQSWPFS